MSGVDALDQLLSNGIATEPTESTDPRTPFVFCSAPPHSHGVGPALVCRLDEMARGCCQAKERNTQSGVVAGFSVGSVAIPGGWGTA